MKKQLITYLLSAIVIITALFAVSFDKVVYAWGAGNGSDDDGMDRTGNFNTGGDFDHTGTVDGMTYGYSDMANLGGGYGGGDGGSYYGGSSGGPGAVPVTPPTATIVCNPNTIHPGNTATVTWSCGNDSTSSSQGSTDGGKNGTYSVTPQTTTTYSVTCTKSYTYYNNQGAGGGLGGSEGGDWDQGAPNPSGGTGNNINSGAPGSAEGMDSHGNW